jgi:hypothetical protein
MAGSALPPLVSNDEFLNAECRKNAEFPNDECRIEFCFPNRCSLDIGHWSFVIVWSFVIRNSTF